MSSEQRNTNTHFDHLKEENSKLSRQVSQLRRKHDRQQVNSTPIASPYIFGISYGL